MRPIIKIKQLFVLFVAIVAGSFFSTGFAEEMVHNHTSFHGGQVGMSGGYHIEMVVRRSGIYQVYISDMDRKAVDIAQVEAKLSVNLHLDQVTDLDNLEYVELKVQNSKAGYFLGRGKSWKKADVVDVTLSAIFPDKQVIFVEFIEAAKDGQRSTTPKPINS